MKKYIETYSVVEICPACPAYDNNRDFLNRAWCNEAGKWIAEDEYVDGFPEWCPLSGEAE